MASSPPINPQTGILKPASHLQFPVCRKPRRTVGERLWNRLFVPLPHFCIYECEGGVMGKAQPLSLLGEADFVHQFNVTRVGAQGIHCEVGPEAGQ